MRGDSTLFIDPASYTMLVLDPSGAVVRVRAVPRMQDAGMISNASYGMPGVDARGRLVYRRNAQMAPPRVRPPAGVPWVPQEPDSAFIVAIDIETRALDTVGAIRLPKSNVQVRGSGDGRGWNWSSMTNPMPLTDDWAVTSDGRVAFVRGRDYRVEYRAADGTRTSGPKLPYDWQRLLEEDKERIVDSVRTLQRRSAERSYASEMIRWVNRYGKREYPKGFTVPEGFTLPNGHPRDWVLPPGLQWPANYIFACAEGEEAKEVAMTAGGDQPAPADGGRPPTAVRPSCIPAPTFIPGGNVPSPPRLREDGVIAASDIPDYKPPFSPGGVVRADLDGGLWIRPIQPTPIAGGPVYDVIDAEGELIDRIQVPPGYQLVGFGKGRVVYLQVRDRTGVRLARVRLR
jgi:hypothetical protein